MYPSFTEYNVYTSSSSIYVLTDSRGGEVVDTLDSMMLIQPSLLAHNLERTFINTSLCESLYTAVTLAKYTETILAKCCVLVRTI